MNEQDIVRVQDVMTPDVKTIDRMQTVAEAIEMMRHSGVSSLIVERRNENDEYGLIVVSDIATKVIGPDKSPDRVNVYDVMTKPVITVHEDMDIRYAVRLLGHFKISRALVIDQMRAPLGIVTLRDMVLRHGQSS